MAYPAEVRTVRPYQLACLLCRAGAEAPHPIQERVADLAALVRETPDMPVALCCNVGDVYAYQDPGPEDDTPEGPDFNRKRDVDLLQWLDLAPGSILPARVAIKRLMARVPTVQGICGYEAPTGPAWEGCPKAFSGDYERGRELGFPALSPPRPQEQMEEDKACSIAAIEQAEVVEIRPHLLLCAVCQYGGGTRPPYPEDNLPELVQMLLEPDCKLKVKLVPGAPWDMCAPCPHRTGAGCCVIGALSCGGLYNEAKDLNVLQAIGLTYGTVMDAREIIALVFEHIPSAGGVCALTKVDLPDFSVWKDGCSKGSAPWPYDTGREMLLDQFG